MITQNRHPVEVVARESGFGNFKRMRRPFLRVFGQSPQALRRMALGQQAVDVS